MRDEKPLLDIENPSERLQALDRALIEIEKLLIVTGLEYTNKVSGSPSDRTIYRIRDSILYRLTSIRNHMTLMVNLDQNTRSTAQELIHRGPHAHLALETLRNHQSALFDSVIFHTCSLFDYVGNMIGYSCNAKRGLQLQWKGTVKSARHKGNRLSDSPLTSVIIAEAVWIDRLYDHRSQVIHFKVDVGSHTTTWIL